MEREMASLRMRSQCEDVLGLNDTKPGGPETEV